MLVGGQRSSESVSVFGRNEGLQIHETPAKSYDKVEYLGAVGALGRSLVPCPWESAQPCRVSGQSREKCSVRNLGGGGEREREGGMHIALPLLVSLFFHIFKRSPFWRRSKMQRQKRGERRRETAFARMQDSASHKTAVSIRAKKRISREQNVAFSVLHVSVSMHNLYMWFWDMREN